MNTAVKALTGKALVWRSFSWRMTRHQFILMLSVAAILLSAFSLVYLKDVNRRLMSHYEVQQSNNIQLRNRWSQLVIQKSKFAGQRHVAALAKRDLHMTLPLASAIVMIHQ
jgi:cell division protein FtsL